MNVKNELLKLTIINRMIEHRLSKDPTAYLDISEKGITSLHNDRAFLINRLTQYTGNAGVVEFVNGKAELIDRGEYLIDYDRLYKLYRSDEVVPEKDIHRLWEDEKI